MNQILNIGVVGYCPPSRFDTNEARRMIKEAFDRVMTNHPDKDINIVSGLTDVGVLGIAYEEATKRGWKTTGIACEKAKEHSLFPVNETHIVGENWGDESEYFVNHIDGIVRIGGGLQSKREVEAVRSKLGEVMEYELALLK